MKKRKYIKPGGLPYRLNLPPRETNPGRWITGISEGLLILGAGEILWVTNLTLRDLTDRTIQQVLIPGFFIGLILIGLSFHISRQRKERMKISSGKREESRLQKHNR